jgi:hypothetical protein
MYNINNKFLNNIDIFQIYRFLINFLKTIQKNYWKEFDTIILLNINKIDKNFIYIIKIFKFKKIA